MFLIRCAALLVPLLVSAPAHANDPDRGACYAVDARDGTPFSYQGKITAISPGEGFTLETDSGSVQVHGIGPFRFWSEEGMSRPQIGDELQVDGYTIDCGQGEENLAVTVTSGGKHLQLRDTDTGLPRWSRGGRRG